MELLKVDDIEEALEKLIKNSGFLQAAKELVPLEKAFGRTLAEDVFCGGDVPGFRRSTVDGYAVKASDTQGAGDSIPAFLRVKAHVKMGKPVDFEINTGECAYIPTGGMLPEGADAAVMEEYCEIAGEQVAVYKSVAASSNVVEADEDIPSGEKVLTRGRIIKPQDMGLLASVGCSEIKVYKPFSIYIISTGDELAPPSSEVSAGKVRDVNTYGLIGMAAQRGFDVAGFERTADSEDELRAAIERGMKKADIVVVSGGSSKGQKDATARIMDELSSSGVLTHGIAVKPGKPTILAVDEPSKSILVGLPGHPVAALIIFEQIVGGFWRLRTGAEAPRSCAARINTNLPASPGRKTFQLVKLTAPGSDMGMVAEPILGKSGLIYNISKADGYIIMDKNQEGLNQGESVTVYYI